MFKGFVREGELRRWSPWAGMALLIVLAVALETSMESACWDADVAKAAKINEATSCFEFWFNRYQTLVGAMAALAAAGVAWIGVRRQIAKADEQIAASDRQNAIALLPVLDERTKYAMKMYLKADDAPRAGERLFRSAETIIEHASAVRVAYVSAQHIKPLIETLNIAIKEYECSFALFSDVLTEISQVQADGISGPAIRQAFGQLWLLLWIKHNNHRRFVMLLRNFSDKEVVTKDDILTFIENIVCFDIEALRIEASAPAFSINDIGYQVGILQDERDHIFDRTRI